MLEIWYNQDKKAKTLLEFLNTEDNELRKKLIGKDEMLMEINDNICRLLNDPWMKEHFNRDVFQRNAAEEKGKEENRLKVVNNLLKETNLNYEMISKVTGLSLKEVSKIAKELKLN